jgi:hypothetical protein
MQLPQVQLSFFGRTLPAKRVALILSPILAGFIFHGDELRFFLRLLNEQIRNKRLHVFYKFEFLSVCDTDRGFLAMLIAPPALRFIMKLTQRALNALRCLHE